MAEVDIDDGHGGAGDNCGDEVVFYGGSAALGGTVYRPAVHSRVCDGVLLLECGQ